MSNALPLLALPGLLNDERLWQAQAAALMPDHPLTAVPVTTHDSMAAIAAAVLSRAPAPRFALAGFAMGGYGALEIMRQAPERVVALALVDTSARPDTAQATEARRAGMAQSRTDFDAVIDALLPRMVHPARLHDKPLVETIRSMAHAVGPAGYVRQQQAIIGRVDSRPTLKQIRCPTLVLCGREDQLIPLEVHEETAAGVANAAFVVLDECGHMAPLERANEVSEAMRSWLSRV
jgi:pimeloyl-ACP methyl ester carboxylesterase